MVSEERGVGRKGDSSWARGSEKWSAKQYSVFPTRQGDPSLSSTSGGCERRKPCRAAAGERRIRRCVG